MIILKRNEIHIRDPFILRVDSQKKYYLYGTTDGNCWEKPCQGFATYCSSDLENWEGPFKAFEAPEDFWADRDFWAPEVHFYNEKYYMLASFKSGNACRGTQVLVSDTPKGPFLAHSKLPVTPNDWECLDGTLYIDEEKQPWMIFCHEWLQVRDGEMCAVKLTQDLSSALGEVHLLFKATDAKWVRETSFESATIKYSTGYVTDGPFIYNTKEGQLVMLWSSFGKEGYAMSIAKSQSGSILGPWIQEKEPLFSKDGGHGMLFKTFDGKLMLTVHAPNERDERAQLIKVIEKDRTVCMDSTN